MISRVPFAVYLRLLLPLAMGWTVGGCDATPSGRWDMVDAPQPLPAEAPAPNLAPEPDSAAEPESVECGPGTGRTPDGGCQPLRTRDVGYVQRVQLPAGEFVRGYVPKSYDARPAATAALPQWSGQPPRSSRVEGFWIDLHEVTREAYAACVETGRCTEARCPGGDDPVSEFDAQVVDLVPQTCVTHDQAQAFCRAHDGQLPTEAQWEYAARGVDGRRFSYGNQLRDEYRGDPAPVTGMNDVSYFGIRGLGSNVAEWVAEAYDPDAGLAEFVQGTFRKPSGPLRVALGDTQGMHVVKSVSVGARAAGDGPDPSRGFRCAADLAATEQALEVPAAAPKVLLVLGDGLQVFSGVAEVVSRSEAEAFCRALVVPSERGTLGDWRLPTLAEIDEVSDVFRGPGPFWTVEGAAAQSKPPGRGAEPGPWGTVSSTKSDVWAARCVRGG